MSEQEYIKKLEDFILECQKLLDSNPIDNRPAILEMWMERAKMRKLELKYKELDLERVLK